MKHRKAELDVDIIGGLGPLTKEDEKAISEFILARKLKRDKKPAKSRSLLNRSHKVKVIEGKE